MGTVDVTVTNAAPTGVGGPGPTSSTSAADHYSYGIAPPVISASQSPGYWMVGNDGGVFSFGGAPFEGSVPALGIHVKNIVAMVPTADGKGYWMIGSDGGVFAFGDAGFVGSIPGLGVHVNDIVGAVPTQDGKGYWMIGSDGGVFAFGDAGFVGSLPGIHVHVSNIVAVVPTADSKGYWMIGSDGGVFAFGDAGFVGSLPGLGAHVNDIVGAVPTSTGKGYWMVGHDGGVFAFGDAGFVGSLPGIDVHVGNIVGVVSTCRRQGLLDGGVRRRGVRLRRRRLRGIAPRNRCPRATTSWPSPASRPQCRPPSSGSRHTQEPHRLRWEAVAGMLAGRGRGVEPGAGAWCRAENPCPIHPRSSSKGSWLMSSSQACAAASPPPDGAGARTVMEARPRRSVPGKAARPRHGCGHPGHVGGGGPRRGSFARRRRDPPWCSRPVATGATPPPEARWPLPPPWRTPVLPETRWWPS